MTLKIKFNKKKYLKISKNLDYNFLTFENILNENFNISSNHYYNIIISLTITSFNFISKEFNKIIEKLYTQKIKPKLIIINLIKNDENEFMDQTIKFYSNQYENLYINYSKNYGFATKFLGFLDSNIKLDPEDKIIFVNDNLLYHDKFTLFYELCYQMYNCDCIFINNDNNNKKNFIFYNNYQSFVNSYHSFSIKYKCLKILLDFYNDLKKIDENILQYNDFIITIFYKLKKLNACGINIFLYNEIDHLLDCNNLELKEKILKHYNIRYKFLNNNIIFENNNENKFSIQNHIYPRNLLYNIENLEYDPNNNNFLNIHFDFKYINDFIIMITITKFNDKKINNLKFMIKNIEYTLNFKIDNSSSRQTFFIKIDEFIIKKPHKKYNFDVIQTFETNEISISKFNSILTILCNLPYLNYKFFNNNDRIKFIKKNKPKLFNVYNKLNVGAYKADLFRLLYVYLEGGIYFDCKNILYQDLDNYFIHNYFFTKDSIDNYICNGFFYSNKHNDKLKNCLLEMIYNIIQENYTKDPFSITGPGLLGKYIKYEILFHYFTHTNDWKESYIKSKNKNQIVILNSYYNYYNENKYLNNNHYGVFWKNKNVFSNISNTINYNKINGINHIIWINFEKSIIKNMRELFSNINIPYTRIYGLNSYILTQLKAIALLNEMDGNNFMICEDDVNFDYINFFDENLDTIIKKAPDFDILILNKITNEVLINIYNNWNNNILSVKCYIISKKGIENIISKQILENNNNQNFIFENSKTIIYKYNFANSLDKNDYIQFKNLIQDKF